MLNVKRMKRGSIIAYNQGYCSGRAGYPEDDCASRLHIEMKNLDISERTYRKWWKRG